MKTILILSFLLMIPMQVNAQSDDFCFSVPKITPPEIIDSAGFLFTGEDTMKIGLFINGCAPKLLTRISLMEDLTLMLRNDISNLEKIEKNKDEQIEILTQEVELLSKSGGRSFLVDLAFIGGGVTVGVLLTILAQSLSN